jgi:hypothetical protein
VDVLGVGGEGEFTALGAVGDVLERAEDGGSLWGREDALAGEHDGVGAVGPEIGVEEEGIGGGPGGDVAAGAIADIGGMGAVADALGPDGAGGGGVVGRGRRGHGKSLHAVRLRKMMREIECGVKAEDGEVASWVYFKSTGLLPGER